MSKLPIALLLVAAAASAQKTTPDPAFARLPGTQLRIADSARIDLSAFKLEPPISTFAGPRGGLVVYSQRRSVIGFDSLGRRQWSQGTGRNDRMEVAEITAIGWKGDEMWVSDASWGQIALLDRYGNVTKSLELPSWVRPPFSQRKSFPVFESMRVYARYADGSMLVLPRGDNVKLGSAPDFDPTLTYLVKIDEDGIIRQQVAKFPSATVRIKDRDGELIFQNPLNQWAFRATPDGSRIVVVNVDTSAAKTDTVVIRSLNDRGGTAWVQKLAYPAMRYTDAQADSIARSRWGNDTEYRERRARALPRRAPAVVDIALDIDRSVWLSLRGNNSMRSVIGFDGAGKVIGKFQLPARRSVKAANLGGLWIGEVRSDVRGDLVRYRMAK